MSLTRETMRIAVATIVFALLALAPTGAKAHPGHSHSTPGVQHSSLVLKKVKPSEAAEVVQDTASQFSASSNAVDQQPISDPCTDRCCKSAMGCCVVIFTSPGETPLPSAIARRLPLSEPVFWTGLGPDRLRRPPKSFT
jgi:hypothetical protein